ncbi:hypothetical protein Pcinc_000658 [Petrolisthes cinctipes]|uniref:RNA-directed DNA polymerase n=1 Tax=Petrolisthes cinctipes TaxID=88211 RepID=A0AAE1L6F2_PETCI|nr:hypothetical protein Pcinc_000658 [Petrolisthes cinctipes]
MEVRPRGRARPARTQADRPEVIMRRTLIVGYHAAGKGIREISQLMGISRATVRLWLRRYEAEGHVLTRPRPERPRVTTKEDDERLRRAVERNPQMTAVTLTREAELPCHVVTTRRRLWEAGLRCHIPARKEMLTEANKQSRLSSRSPVLEIERYQIFGHKHRTEDEKRESLGFRSWVDVVGWTRIEINAVQLGLDYNQLAKEQQQDPETTAVRTAITALQRKDVPLGDSNISILCDMSTGRPRPWIPSSLRRHVFNLIHGLSHPSRRATTRLLTQKFTWHKISRDAGNWVRSCVPCQKSKVHRHTETGPGTFHQPQRRFAHIHVDVVGPHPPSDGHRYLFTIIDRSTRWPEAIPMANATSTSCASSLLSGWISRFGIPEHITSDHGTTFTSHLWTFLGQLMGTTVHHTTAYNP